MPEEHPGSRDARADSAALDVQAAYDAVARSYAAELGDELNHKPLDRALLESLVALSGAGVIADVGCGPGHITRFLAARHLDVIGIDLSPGMVAVAREHSPGLSFTVGSMLALPASDGVWAGAVALYSIIHMPAAERAAASREFARVLRPGGWLLVAFHIDSPDFAIGEVNHLTSWFGKPVKLDGLFLDPAEVTTDLHTAGLTVTAKLERQPDPAAEYPSRRCYLLAHKH